MGCLFPPIHVTVHGHDFHTGHDARESVGMPGRPPDQSEGSRPLRHAQKRRQPMGLGKVDVASPPCPALGSLGTGRSPEVAEAVTDGVRIATVRAAQNAVEHDTVLHAVGAEDEPEFRSATRTGKPVRQQEMHGEARVVGYWAGGVSTAGSGADAGPYCAHWVGVSQTRVYSRPSACSAGRRFFNSS